MKRAVIATLAMSLLAVLPAVASGATQGDFALALARILGFEVATDVQAVEVLAGAQIAPIGGWQVARPLTTEVIRQVERALGLASAAGIVGAVQTDGAIEAAAAAVDFAYTSSGSRGSGTPTSIPPRAPIGGPQGTGEGLEGSPFRP